MPIEQITWDDSNESWSNISTATRATENPAQTPEELSRTFAGVVEMLREREAEELRSRSWGAHWVANWEAPQLFYENRTDRNPPENAEPKPTLTHNIIVVWLTPDLEGYECSRCGTQALESTALEGKECVAEPCECANCDHGLAVFHRSEILVTKEMANDAGDPSLEGQVYSSGDDVLDVCNCCGGDFEYCKRCRESSSNF